jgi:BirA family biotin operon repressor/biotin-[acetyl-CoA-carboxylase] ligase
VADRKLAGILIEALPDRRHIIGIGINTNNSAADAPQELQATVATMRDLTGHIVDPTEMLVDLLKKMEREFSNLCRNPEHITHRADVICWQRDRTLTMQCGGRTMMGRCRGIAADGSLRLETPEGLKNICSGVILCVS